MSRPRVVVAGLGDSGVLAAIRLSRHADVVGISTKPAWVSGQELGLRLARPERWQRDHRIDFDRFRGLDGVRVVHGGLVGVDLSAGSVSAVGVEGERITEPFDALVIATGVTNGFWRRPVVQDVSALDADLAGAHSQIAAAGTVAVIGGGAAAMSTAAQVAERWPSKAVDLYFPGDRALPHHHRRVWGQVQERLTALGVSLHPGHRAVLRAGGAPCELTSGSIEWSTGQAPASADVVVWAVGSVQPNTDWLPSSMLDDDGFVRVAPSLQVAGLPQVFAVGDVAATDPLRTSARNQGHKVIAHNVRAHLAGKPLRDYQPPRRRWGSVLGAQRDGLVVFAPTGRGFRLPRWSLDAVLQPFVVRRGIYGGVRRDRTS